MANVRSDKGSKMRSEMSVDDADKMSEAIMDDGPGYLVPRESHEDHGHDDLTSSCTVSANSQILVWCGVIQTLEEQLEWLMGWAGLHTSNVCDMTVPASKSWQNVKKEDLEKRKKKLRFCATWESYVIMDAANTASIPLRKKW